MESEYCLLWVHTWLPPLNDWGCLTAGVWAAWAQGLLSAGAVFYSVTVSKRQHELDGIRQRNANRQAVIDWITGVITLLEQQLVAVHHTLPWVKLEQDCDLKLHNEIHARGQVIGGYNVHASEPLDVRWLLFQVQDALGGALKYYQRIWDQRSRTGVQHEEEGPLIRNFLSRVASAQKHLGELRQWRNEYQTKLE